MNALAGIELMQLVQVPAPAARRHPDRQSGAEEPDRLLAAIAGLHGQLRTAGADEPVLLSAWARLPGDAALTLLVGGRPAPSVLAAAADEEVPDRPVSMLFPPGAQGVHRGADATRELERFAHWVPVVVRHDQLWAPAAGERSGPSRRGWFDKYAAAGADPFAWVVLAEPLDPSATQTVLDALTTEILPLTRAEVGQARRVELERAQARHRELSRAQAGGTWRVRVLVGGDTPAQA
ncbi:MAG: hypothetical protein QM622_00020, partial [Microbacterium sp.]